MRISEKAKKSIFLAIIAVCVVAMLVLGIDYGVNKKNEPEGITFDEPAETVPVKEEKVLVSVSTDTLQEGLQGMGVLITQEYYFTQVEKYTKEKKFLKVLSSSSEMMYSYDGAVQAGIDFEKIEISKDDSTKTLTITLPKSEIQTVTIDKDTFKVYSEKDSLWNPLKLDDYNLSLAEFEDAAKQKALDSGILERSDEQAKTLVENFISNFPSASEYGIVFK